jgi:GMP synthase (glutamine-hydrolysing)
MAHIHYLQHVPFEGIGAIADWVALHGHTVSATRFFEPYTLPGMDQLDILVIMGGPMNVMEHEQYPWLVTEKRFIREAIEAGKPVLGICLGAQLIAATMGCRIFRNGEKEIGWFPVYDADGAGEVDTVFRLGEPLTVFHWHGETFDLPKGSVNLYQSDGCTNQGFLLGDRVLGLQFHFEATPHSVAEISENGADDLSGGGKYVQEAQQLIQPNGHYRRANLKLFGILDYLISVYKQGGKIL